MNWALRYAPHVGYLPPADARLFRALAPPDRVEQVRLAAREGFAGILHPWAGESSREEREAVGDELRKTGLACSCVLGTPLSGIMDPVWVASGTTAHDTAIGYVRDATVVAASMGSSTVALLLRSDGGSTAASQRQRVVDRLRDAADLASKQGIVLAIEPMIDLPDMFLQTFADGVELVREVAHPGVKLIFDTGHVSRMGDPLLETYVEAYDSVAVLQLADMPGRVEPGGGSLDLTPLLAHAINMGYRGLVDLEFDWSQPGEAGERAGLQRLKMLDERAQGYTA